MDEILAYFQQGLEHPGTVEPWDQWWGVHGADVRLLFDYSDYLRLRFRKFDAARMILERRGFTVTVPADGRWWEMDHCPRCGERLLKTVNAVECPLDCAFRRAIVTPHRGE